MQPSAVLLTLLVMWAGQRVAATPTTPLPSQLERPPLEEASVEDGHDEGSEDDDDDKNGFDLDYIYGDDEGGEDDDDADDNNGFDLDYIVNRPTTPPPEDEKETKEFKEMCKKLEEVENVDGDVSEYRCEKEKDLAPYLNYPKYKTWTRRPLFIIIIGGLRWDYLTESTWNMSSMPVSNMKAFNWIKKHGTTMSQVVPVFPPYDLPSWTSMATGLYPETTGVTGDFMYNLKTKDLFSRNNEEDTLDRWWIEGEPIWSVAAKHGRKVSVLNWHDCTLPGKNIEEPKDCKPFSSKVSMPSKQKLIQLFNQAFTKIHKDKYDLSIVYTDVVKKVALEHGPNSPEVMKTILDLDDILQGRLSDIKNKKERADLKLNILLLSDYGLNGRTNTTKLVLDDYIDFDYVQYIIQRGGSTILVPYALKTGHILHGIGDKLGVSQMQGVEAYVRDVNLETPPLESPLIPEELRYGDHTWTQDILLIAQPGFEIEVEEASYKVLPPLGGPEMGTSGYHPNPAKPEPKPGRDKHKSKELRAREKELLNMYQSFAHMMKTVGFAWGPDFRPDYVSAPIESVDLYQIIAFLLNIPPNDHDGDWDRVRPMLMVNGSPVVLPSLLTFAMLLLTLILAH